VSQSPRRHHGYTPARWLAGAAACVVPNACAGLISSHMATNGNESSLVRKSRADGVHEVVRQRIRQYPYLAIATGAGVAWVVAGGLTARKTRRVLGTICGVALFSPILIRLIGMGVTMLDTRRT
jgi:hypothetical protein